MDQTITELLQRVRRLEDEAEITRLLLSYGPAADAGLTAFAGQLWVDDGVYDWDAEGQPHLGSAGVDAMLQGDQHQGLIARGVAHFAGPPLIMVDGDQGTAVNYSLVMRRESEQDRFFLWRVSAVRWDVERVGGRWRVRRRTNRLLDQSGAGRQFFVETLQELFEEARA
jgi:hypothetical protein